MELLVITDYLFPTKRRGVKMINYEMIPKSIMDKGMSLKELGILEFAWNVNDIKRIIDTFSVKKNSNFRWRCIQNN